MTKIEFEVREKDLINFNLYNFLQHPKIGKMFTRHQFVFPVVLGVIAIYMYALLGYVTYALPVALTSIAWAVFVPLYLKYNLKKQAHALYSEEEKLNILGPHTFQTEKKHLLGSFPSGETRIAWKDIARAELQKKYLYLYLDAERALIIPKETISNGSYSEFLVAIDKHLQTGTS